MKHKTLFYSTLLVLFIQLCIPCIALAQPANAALLNAMRDAVDFESDHSLEGLAPPQGDSLQYTQPLIINKPAGGVHEGLEYRLVVYDNLLVYALELESPLFGYDTSYGAPFVRLSGDATRRLKPSFDSGSDFALVAISGGIYIKTSNSLDKIRDNEGSFDSREFNTVYTQPLSEYITYNKYSLSTYELNSDEMVSGIVAQNGELYYIDEQGNYVQNQWVTLNEGDNSKRYFCGSDGIMVVGWRDISGSRYYFDPTTREQLTGWQRIGDGNGHWYYLDPASDGALRTGLFRDNSGKLYITNDSGAMQSGGWAQYTGKWYYLSGSGVAAESSWRQIGGKWYLFDANGCMVTGWQRIGSSWYYFNGSGAMHTGWLKSGSGWYYLKGSGSMAISESLTIAGATYRFDSSGLWVR